MKKFTEIYNREHGIPTDDDQAESSKDPMDIPDLVNSFDKINKLDSDL